MPKLARVLGDKEVRALRESGFHRVGGVTGLGLQITDTGAKSWVLRYRIAGKDREKGLGSFRDIGLGKAREVAREAREKISQGIDPIQAAEARRSQLVASRVMDVTFKECATTYIAVHEKSWKNAKHRQQWENTLETYAYPHFGNLFVRDVTMQHVLKALEPIWHTTTETATRVRSRIKSILGMAIAKGYRSGPNPAEWSILKESLAAPGKIAKGKHHPAVRVEQVPDFMADLRVLNGTGARALEFIMLTAARSGEVRGARWSEFDMERKVWTVPAGRMKANKQHFVPLSKAAVKLLKAQPHIDGEECVFPSPRKGGPLSDMTMSQLMRRMGYQDEDGRICVPHGLRSTFTDWAGDYADATTDLTEMALAHAIADKTRAAYRRRSAFEKRRVLMEQWATFCNTPFKHEGGDVLQFRAA